MIGANRLQNPTQIFFIVSVILENDMPKSPNRCFMPSVNVLNASLTPFHICITAVLNSSLVFHSVITTAVTAAIAATAIATGLVSSVIAPPMPLIASIAFPNISVTVPTFSITFPTATNIGAIAATTKPILTMVSFWLSFSPSNHSAKLCTFSATVCKTGCSTVKILCPNWIAVFFSSVNVCCSLYAVVLLMVSNAVFVAPVLSFISPNISLKSLAPSPNRIKPAFAASLLLNISLNDKFCSFAAPSTISRTSPKLEPVAINSLNDFPVFSLKILSVVLPVFPSSFNILLTYVVLSAVATPFAVVIAYAAHSCSNATLLAFAVGITLPIALDSSATVVLPLFCVCTNKSETCVTSLASMPYAFNTVLKMSIVSLLSAKPAVASFVACVTKFTASPVLCPAEIALYTLSAISVAAIPVWLDKSRIAVSISSKLTSVSSIMVPTLASAVSKLTAIVADTVPTPAIAVVIPIIFSPAPFILPPAVSIFSPNSFILAADSFFSTLPNSISMLASSLFALSVAFSTFSNCCAVLCILPSVFPSSDFKAANCCSNFFVSSLSSPVAFLLSSNAFSVSAIFVFKLPSLFCNFVNSSRSFSAYSLFNLILSFCVSIFAVNCSAFACSCPWLSPNNLAFCAAREYSV